MNIIDCILTQLKIKKKYSAFEETVVRAVTMYSAKQHSAKAQSAKGHGGHHSAVGFEIKDYVIYCVSFYRNQTH